MDNSKYMLEFASPFVFLLLPMPLLIKLLSKPASNNGRSEPLITPLFNDIAQIKSQRFLNQFNQKQLLKILALLAWIFLTVATARPRLVGSPMPLDFKGRELLLAIDVSGSMQIADFTLKNKNVNRMTAVREIASEFIKKRCGDKIGLIFFGTKAYLRSPPSFDCQTIYNFTKDAEIGVAGTNTAIGDAIAMAVKYTNSEQKVLVLLTDGANNSGLLSPYDAASLAVETGLKIYTIGIGTKQNNPADFFGLPIYNASTYDIDEEALNDIAKRTGGKFYLAQNTRELSLIYNEIDKLELIASNQDVIKPVKELFYLPLAAAMALSLLVLIMLCPNLFIKKGGKTNDS